MADLINFNNTNYSGGVPINLGDRYYSQDLGRDIDYLRSLPGRELKNMFNSFPVFISGGLVTQGAGVTLNITAAVGICKFAVTVPNSYSSFPPTTQSKDIVVLVESTQQTNLAVTPAGTTYVKLRYKELNGSSRTHAWTGGSKVYDVSDSFEFVVDGTPNTDYDVLLATFTESGGILTITQQDWTNTRILNYNMPFQQRNIILNGEFRIAQENTSYTDASAAWFHTVDGWAYSRSASSGRATIAQVSNTESSTGYAKRITVTTPDVSIASSDFYYFYQPVEGYDFYPLKKSTGLLSFWVKSSKAGIYTIGIGNSVPNRFYIKEYTITTANISQLIKLEFPFATETTGTWLNTNGVGCHITFSLAIGSDLQDSPNQWNANDRFCTSNQVNFFDSTNTFEIWDVQLINGTINDYHPIRPRPFAEELALCQRRYEKSYEYLIALGSTTSLSQVQFTAFNTNSCYSATVQMKVQKRISPSLIFYSPITGAINKIRNYSTGGDINFIANTELATYFISANCFSIASNSNLLTANQQYGTNWIADSRL